MPKHIVVEGEKIVGIYTIDQTYVAVDQEDPENPVTAETHYYPGGAIAERPEQSNSWNKTTVLADGEDLMIMSGLDPATEVYVQLADLSQDRIQVPVLGGEAKIAFMSPGDYTVTVLEWPKRDLVDAVTAQEVLP